MRAFRLSLGIATGTVLLLTGCMTKPVADMPARQTDACELRLTQHGFLPSASKTVILRTLQKDPVAFEVRDAAGGVVGSGMSVPGGKNAASGDSVHTIELARDLPVGEGYTVSACGGVSHPFAVRADLYAGLSEDALRYFYHNRIGTEIKAEYVQGPQWARRASLTPLSATCFSGEDMFGNTWPGCDYELDVTGSWFDAGDFGVYPVNLGVSVWTLQHAYERMAQWDAVAEAGWADGRMQLPETGNGVSELLDEARWGMESLLKLQVPEGGKVWVPKAGTQTEQGKAAELEEIDAGGMVHHKLAGRKWPPLPIWPWNDDQERLLYPPSTSATLGLAATGAQCARLWAGVDDDFAGRCFAAAQRAYEAAKAHPEIYASNGFDGSGGYGDDRLGDEFAWAALELYETTGDPAYLADLRANPAFGPVKNAFGWADVDLMPALTLSIRKDARDRQLTADGQAIIVRAAEEILAIRDGEGYRFPLGVSEYYWGSNSLVLNRGLVLAAAFYLTGEARFRDGAVDAMEYVLGRNVLDQSYVSGYGVRSMRAPHHRIWAGAVNPEFPLPPPGALAGGANNTAMADPVAQQMKGKCAPMACWADDVESYAMNEVAINWNAPLAALAIYLDHTERRASAAAANSKE